MRDYSEKRDFIRMAVDCTIHFGHLGASDAEEGTLIDLSATGLQFQFGEAFDEGTRLWATIPTGTCSTPPLALEIRVVRSIPGPGDFTIAASIEQITDAESTTEMDASPSDSTLASTSSR